MRYNIIIPRSVSEQIKRLETHERQEVRDHIEKHLRYQPTRTSKSRIKRLKDCDDPQYRLRVGDIRVFYNVVDDRVELKAVLSKKEATEWLKQGN